MRTERNGQRPSWSRSGCAGRGRGFAATLRRVVALTAAAQLALPAQAWNAHGHRIITLLALDGLPPEAPAWLRDPAVRARIAYQSNEADRWRGTPLDPIGHENKPDHYIDVELLEQFGLTLATVPPFRYDYVQAMAVAKHVHPERVDPYDGTRDRDRSRQWPGFLPHAIAEHYAKLVSALRTARILEALKDPRRAEQLEMARANVIYHMGMLSHFVGDAAQPLHTTRHHNGWEGPNPDGYTTSREFHAYIDGGILRRHGLTYEAVKEAVRYERRVDAARPWNDVLAHVQRAFDQVEPLYRLEKSGELDRDAGRGLLLERLADGASMLAALYGAAWEQSAPTQEQIDSFVRFDEFNSNEELKVSDRQP